MKGLYNPMYLFGIYILNIVFFTSHFSIKKFIGIPLTILHISILVYLIIYYEFEIYTLKKFLREAMCEEYSNTYSFLIFGVFGFMLKFLEYILF